ncbi:methyl-accepting chemotaxis protein [Marinobacter daepoensis]|uniref:HAMP domain-containing protein n=1 Tax=Marinobacter daepoensis TaxID=262077 RepID=A0ABS3BE09_9GAMM|nr:methyl-accepting chemotaxis protein [Marinobacter daepoensis]MBN7770073.1 HAMP domain-containing protein [Marinobacter daepoensis]MBY6034798.1 methyl-accepting chemotaxis protein [Marinobacter daepoensis]MBY6080787.1 methyl-accepting chemotaxis protein [Marinobacter daepoensis]
MKKQYSIRFLLLAALAAAFTVILVFTVVYSAQSQRAHLEEYSHKYVDGLAKSFFDGLNTMMVTGTIGNRDVLREKVMAPEDVLDVRVIRSDQLNAMYGAGNAAEQRREPLDRQALGGDRVEHYSENEDGRVYTLIEPVIASANYQGVNCLGCHQASEGDVLGAIRVDYSLAKSDTRLQQQLMVSGGIQILIFVGIFVLTAVVLGRLVFSRLRRLHDRMDEISRNSDLSIELEVTRNDEIGSVSRAFNRMVAKIRASMHTVMDNAEQVEAAARTIAGKAETTEREVLAQKDNTDQVASATTEMAASAVQVRENAVTTARKSADTAGSAQTGEQLARNAVQGIESLNAEVQNGAQRIEQLDQRTSEMASRLELISEIADQTNLLALNAAIEAARAGEQGRGFAVVADEVRALASRTQASTEEIRQTIEGLKKEVVDCVGTMRHASELAQHQVDSILKVETELQTIAAAVREITGLNEEMESAANEQSEVSDSINQNVIEISRSAEQTSSDAQETARIAGDLLAMAETLRKTIEQFRLAQS